MTITSDRVREIFKGLEKGEGAAFFEHVADNVDWAVMGTNPLAGHYHSKRAFVDATFSKLGKVLPKGAQLRVTNEIVAGDTAVVELVSDATARNGMRFDNHYCWVTRFDRGAIVEVRAYLDSAMVAELFRQNPIAIKEGPVMPLSPFQCHFSMRVVAAILRAYRSSRDARLPHLR